jgi:hypothetical protein
MKHSKQQFEQFLQFLTDTSCRQMVVNSALMAFEHYLGKTTFRTLSVKHYQIPHLRKHKSSQDHSANPVSNKKWCAEDGFICLFRTAVHHDVR